MKQQLATLLALLLTATCSWSAEPSHLLEGFSQAQAMIETSTACHLLDIWVAETSEQRAQGLMFVRSLGEYEGMLFPGQKPAVLRMWMKNTYIPLDMLFIGEDSRIIGITAQTTPLSEATISSPGPALGVLELRGGFAARHGVKTGDRFALY